MAGTNQVISYSIPGDLHLFAQLQLKQASDFRAYFDEAETSAKNYLSADVLYIRDALRPVRQEALDRMKRISSMILVACETGRKALKKRNKAEALLHANKIFHLSAERRAEPDRERGEYELQSATEGGETRARAFKVKRTNWQSRAEEIWRERPDFNVSETARKIARETGDKWETIRKAIKRKGVGK